MPFYQAGAIKYFKFPSLDDQGIFHAVFTRHGGYSPAPWSSLNFGASVGDDSKRVMHNREIALRSLNLDPTKVFDLYQVHSTNIVFTDRPLSPGEQHQKADAIVTNQPNVILMMRFADCVPILMFDPKNHVVSISHAGWVGTVDQIASKTVMFMHEKYGTDPENLIAGIGPSICPDHYPIGKEVLNRIHTSFGYKTDLLVYENNDKTYFDLWKANQLLLNEVGVKKVEISRLCTYCNLRDWFSHRGENGKTGRFGVVIGLF